MGVDASYAGRSIKCSCGNVFKASGTPVSATPSSSSRATTPSAAAKPKTPTAASGQPGQAPLQKGKPLSSGQTSAKPNGKPAVPAAPVSSFLDQLTESDFARPSSNPYDPPASTANSDASVLKKYAGPDTKAKEMGKAANSNIIFLAVLNFIGAALNIVTGTLVLIVSSVLASVSDVLPLAALGVLFSVLVYFLGLFDLIAGIGLVKRTAWGWWICTIGLGWAFFDRGFGIVILFMRADDWTAEIPKAIGICVYLFSCFYFWHFMSQKRTMKLFQLELSSAIVWSVTTAVGLLLGGISFGVALTALPGPK
jgi:hypothetical protein